MMTAAKRCEQRGGRGRSMVRREGGMAGGGDAAKD